MSTTTGWAEHAFLSNELAIPVVIVGAVGVGLAIAERGLVKHGQTGLAETIEAITNIAISVITAVGAFYFLGKSIPLFL